MQMKGISPLVATVLLIAFTVAVAGIISVWLTGFARTSTSTVGKESERQLICSYAAISLRSVKYSTSSSTLSGILENSGSVAIGNLSLQIIYANATTQKFELCLIGNQALNCSVSNISLAKYGDAITFNVSASRDFDTIIATGNCSTRDEIGVSEVSLA
jgi:flagellin-like protein